MTRVTSRKTLSAPIRSTTLQPIPARAAPLSSSSATMTCLPIVKGWNYTVGSTARARKFLMDVGNYQMRSGGHAMSAP